MELLTYKEWLKVMDSEDGEFHKVPWETRMEWYLLYLARNKEESK